LNHSYMDIGNARYLEIGSRKSIASSLGSYDDIRSPNLLQAPTSSRIYLSADNLSLIQYDDIKNNPEEEEEEELHSSALVMATPCMVLEEQLDSLSYVYDDIGRRDEPDGDHRREELCGDLGLYESIAGSLLNLARSKAGSSMEDLYEVGLGGGRRMSSISNRSGGVHEVVSYTLEESSLRGSSRSSAPSIGRRSSSRSSAPSMERRSSSTMERRSVTSESSEWVDIETDFEDYEDTPMGRHVHFVRSSVRQSNRKKFSRGSARLGQGWNRAVREVLGSESASGNEDSEELYESIYEVIRQPSSESDFEEIQDDGDEEEDREEKTSNLSKLLKLPAGRS